MLAISTLSTVYIQVPVNNTEGIDPTSDPVSFSFIGPYGTVQQASNYPPTSSTTWYTGTWDAGTPYTARVLVGPDGVVVLATGAYQVYVRVTDSPEVPVLWSGPMQVF